MAIKLVAFDWNGTLLSDTQPTWKSVQYIYKFMGMKPISFKRFQETFDIPIIKFYMNNGMPKKEFLKKSKIEAELYHKYYESQVTKIRSRGGARETLRWLKKNNIDRVIYSNHTIHGIEKQLKRLSLKHLINKVLATPHGHSVQLKRGKSQKLKSYIAAKGYKKTEVISIGDTCEEIQIGRKLGLHTVAITGGFHSVSRLKAAEPNFIIHNLADLKTIIRKLSHD